MDASEARAQWNALSGEVHALSRRLCEKLRLVLEPLVATKLRGDYRTGKRINMKRVIGYIASGYRKDKIWLRRTKPAKRNYRVLVAVDDSESMSNNGAGQMAMKALATLSTGMSQLEIGAIGVAKFGNDMQMIHPFQTPFTSESGVCLMQHFKFDQTHHIKPKRFGGSHKLNNLLLLHKDCHKQVEYSTDVSLQAAFVKDGCYSKVMDYYFIIFV